MRAALLFVMLAACDGLGDKDTGSTDPDDDTGAPDTDTGTPPIEMAHVTGTVSVRLTTTTEAGEVVDLSWDDATGGVFAYGGILVAAYTEDEETGALTYRGTTVIAAPTVEENAFDIEIDPTETGEVYLYAALDYWVDGVIGTTEPIGTWPVAVAVSADTPAEGVEIVIVAPWLTGGGGGGTYVEIAGDVDVTASFDQGAARAMLYDVAGNGPYYTSAEAPLDGDGTGAGEGPYALSVAASFGEADLRAAWDSNHNGLVEPTDAWGAYASSPGTEGNPISIGPDALSGYDLEIPLGDPPAIVPSVRLEGELRFGGTFDELPAGANVYAVAMRRKPSPDVLVETFPEEYHFDTFSGGALVGETLAYRLVVPANTGVFLYAFVDVDGDGLVNEAGELVGSYGGGSGWVAGGNVSQTGLDIRMGVP
jgi:hypothetical protein